MGINMNRDAWVRDKKDYPISQLFTFKWVERTYDSIIKNTVVFSKMSQDNFAGGMTKEDFIKRLRKMKKYLESEIKFLKEIEKKLEP